MKRNINIPDFRMLEITLKSNRYRFQSLEMKQGKKHSILTHHYSWNRRFGKREPKNCQMFFDSAYVT